MAWLLFLDESGHDHKQMPYEVRGGVALQLDLGDFQIPVAVLSPEEIMRLPARLAELVAIDHNGLSHTGSKRFAICLAQGFKSVPNGL